MNALRFRAVERSALRDPETKAYSRVDLEDAVRNAIQKASRFGHRFPIVRLEGDDSSTGDTVGGSARKSHFAKGARRLGGVMLGEGERISAKEFRGHLSLVDPSSLFLLPTRGGKVTRSLLRILFGRFAP